MKTNKFNFILTLMLWFACFQFSYASYGGGNIMGQVTDPETKQPVSDATVVLDCQGNQRIFYTNDHGYYYASNIPAGVYDITVSYFSNSTVRKAVVIGNEESREINIQLGNAVNGIEVPITTERDPIINPLDPTGDILRRKTFGHMPIQSVPDITENIAGVIKVNGEYYVHGARSGSLAYYIDGAKVMGTPDIPLCGLDTYRSYTGFIPPKYGDCTGGVVVMETRNFFGQ